MKTIFNFTLQKDHYTVKLSKHATKRMRQRNITKKNIVNNILSLTQKEIEYLSRNKRQAIILDKELGISVVIGFNKEFKLVVITVINQKKICSKPTTVEFEI